MLKPEIFEAKIVQRNIEHRHDGGLEGVKWFEVEHVVHRSYLGGGNGDYQVKNYEVDEVGKHFDYYFEHRSYCFVELEDLGKSESEAAHLHWKEVLNFEVKIQAKVVDEPKVNRLIWPLQVFECHGVNPNDHDAAR